MKQLLKYFALIFISSLVLSLMACHQKADTQQQKIITVQVKPLQQSLYFSGIIEPLSKQPIISPVKGVVTNKYFEYGQKVKKGQPLLTITSTMQQDNFQSALTNYLKAKQALNTSQDKMKSTASLYKQDLVSKDSYQSDKTSYYLNQLTYTQAKNKLSQIIKYHHIDNLSKLSITDTAKINKILKSNKQSSTINIVAPDGGIALFASDNSTSTDDNKIDVGSAIKDGQILLYIGNMDGISTTIRINEININQIKEKQKAKITSIAFPDITLHGFISNIDTQASGNNNLPVFTTKIVVPKLTTGEKKTIHIGMSTKIALIPDAENKIVIPISTVFQKNNKNMVALLDKITGKSRNVPVTTGQTTLNNVVITSGLKPGDQVIVAH